MSGLELEKESGLIVGDAELDQGSAEEKEIYGTANDKSDMRRLGKLQQLRRSFRFFSTLGYAMVLGCTWEFALIASIFSLGNGGPAGAIWMFLIVAICFYFVMLSLAEMTSMAPTSGGQYHWVSEFAPAKYQKLLSFIVGWLCVVAWQSGMVLTAFTVAQQLMGIISLSNPDYVIKGWHGSLLTMAVTLFCIFFNTYLVRKLPLLEGLAMAIHFLGFFVFLIVLWVTGPREKASTVFTDFQDNNGWGNVGLATLVGLLSPITTIIGADAVCHLSEETGDASLILPRSMITTATINYTLGFIMTITLMFTVGNVEDALGSATGQPYIEILLNATNSKGGTIAMTVLLTLTLLFCAINQVTTSSRQLFAFARDNGLPYSAFLCKIQPGWDIPVNAVIVTLIFTILVSLIIIGSTIPFFIITSLVGVGLTSSYIIAISCIIYKRVRGETLPPSRFSLGRAGLPINIAAVSFLLLAYVMLFFPAAPHPTPQSMNWTALIYGSAIVFSLTYYYIYARHVYVGPVTYVRKDL